MPHQHTCSDERTDQVHYRYTSHLLFVLSQPGAHIFLYGLDPDMFHSILQNQGVVFLLAEIHLLL